jgi:hypothetical protein
MRTLEKTWRNDRGGKWDARIIWYSNADDTDIRLKLEVLPQRVDGFGPELNRTTHGIRNVIFQGASAKEQAQKQWDRFKEEYKKK